MLASIGKVTIEYVWSFERREAVDLEEMDQVEEITMYVSHNLLGWLWCH